MEYRELLLNIVKEFSKLSSIFMKVVEIQRILNILRWHLTVFPSDFNNIYLKYFGILQNYEILWKLMKATILQDIFSVKSLAFIPFRSIAMYFLHFVILYRDKQNFSVCYCTVSPLDNIGKYFAIVKRSVTFPTSQMLSAVSVKNYIFRWAFYSLVPLW